jgi:hypothetical protein
MTNQKKHMKKYKKRGSFYRRPDHSSNQKKRRRASSQKLDTSMDKPSKTIDDEPIEVDEICQEEAEAALIEEDDQGSDYEIDEYLDEPSKLFNYFTFKIL